MIDYKIQTSVQLIDNRALRVEAKFIDAGKLIIVPIKFTGCEHVICTVVENDVVGNINAVIASDIGDEISV